MIKNDLDNPTCIKAWAAVQMWPWDVHVFQTKQDAEEAAALLGPDYQVKYGSYRPGTDDFIWLQ